MSTWCRCLLALALIAIIPFVLCTTDADAQFAGIFDLGLDLDDDLDELLHYLMPRMAAETSAGATKPVFRPLRLSGGPVGPGATTWPGRTPSGRAPPEAGAGSQVHPRSIQPSPRTAPSLRSPAEQHLTIHFHFVIPAGQLALPGSAVCASVSTHNPHPPTDHRLLTERTAQWPA